jgi:hypothetical protein
MNVLLPHDLRAVNNKRGRQQASVKTELLPDGISHATVFIYYHQQYFSYTIFIELVADKHCPLIKKKKAVFWLPSIPT